MAAGWTSSPGSGTAGWYRDFAEHELHGISPSYEAICRGVAADAQLCARLDALPPGKQQPNLLLGAVRFLGGPVSSWLEFRRFAVQRWDDVAATMLAGRTQTNEPRRCATLLPVLAALPQPLALLEVGASAGLCLYPDRYSYRYEHPRRYVGPPLAELGDGKPLLRCAVSGPAPLPERLPEVVWRAGLDLNPLDVTSEQDLRWLESLIWPEETDRFGLLHEAASVAAADPPVLIRGDLASDFAALAAEAPADATLVVFHTAVLAYVDEPGRAAFADTVDRLAAQRPTVWLANEAPGVVAGTENLPRSRSRFVLTRDRLPLAMTGGHGQSLDWLG
ncbi:MAG TPA: DUF2332 domain-containing protein [Jatrophihabitans sp.]|nr:DUF2332 domain-containing protein [Jatrophihabitans sp.]